VSRVSAHETLGLLLVREGLITRPQLYDALRLQRQTGRLLGTCLLSLGHVRAEALLAMLSRQLSIPALPPGSLNRASPEAIRRVPREVALRLRILPYSWDGQMIGVAVADGRVLSQLREVAYHARAAVGAYVALETEIDAVLRAVYPEAASLGAAPTGSLEGAERPRPPRTSVASSAATAASGQGDTRGPLRAALDTLAPSELGGRAAVPHAPVSPTRPAAVRPSAAPTVLERVSFFDAVELLYEAESEQDIGRMVGRALLNYFQRVFVLYGDGERLRMVGAAGASPQQLEIALSALPVTAARIGERALAYGPAAADNRATELAFSFGLKPGATALVASVGVGRGPRLVLLADNGETTDLYDDLHDVELLLKEAETGLGMLLERRP
jgi:hypothetical protein